MIKFLYFDTESTNPVFLPYDKDTLKAVTIKSNRCMIEEYLKKMKESGFDTTKLPIQKRMVIGGVSFPVTDFRNGMVIVDYPEIPLKK